MVDVDTFLTTLLDVTVDEYAKAHPSADRPRPGRPASLTPSAVVTLALFGQWALFSRERAFSRYARRHLRAAFPGLPARSQDNRWVRRHDGLLVAVGGWLAARLGAATCG